MWIDDCEQKLETDFTQPIIFKVIKEPYINMFGKVWEDRVIETTIYKIDEFGNKIKWIMR